MVSACKVLQISERRKLQLCIHFTMFMYMSYRGLTICRLAFNTREISFREIVLIAQQKLKLLSRCSAFQDLYKWLQSHKINAYFQIPTQQGLLDCQYDISSKITTHKLFIVLESLLGDIRQCLKIPTHHLDLFLVSLTSARRGKPSFITDESGSFMASARYLVVTYCRSGWLC